MPLVSRFCSSRLQNFAFHLVIYNCKNFSNLFFGCLGVFRYSLNLITALADMRFKWLGRKLVHEIAEGFCMLALLFFISVYMLGLQHELRFVASLAVLSVMGQT